MQFIETPPPPLLRARFATVLVHLPSVPTVVLPILSPVLPNRALSLLNPYLFGSVTKDKVFGQNGNVSVCWRGDPFKLTLDFVRSYENDKIRHFLNDKFCAGRLRPGQNETA
jgi:hypothetical protein